MGNDYNCSKRGGGLSDGWKVSHYQQPSRLMQSQQYVLFLHRQGCISWIVHELMKYDANQERKYAYIVLKNHRIKAKGLIV